MLKKLLLAITIGISSASAVAAADIGATSGQFYGLNYGINPNACPSYEQIKSDFTTIKKYTNRVRTFSMSVCNLAALALQAANELNMDIYLGMWIDTPATFQAEMAALTSVIQSGASFANVDAIIVGSEVLYRKDTDAAALADYIHKVGVMARPKGIKITTADVYYMFPPNVVAELDFLMMNAFPYWEGVTAQQGAAKLLEHYNSVVADKSLGKPVRISETGWPSDGPSFGASVASAANAKLYLSNVLCQTRQKGIDLLYFEAFDEPYKGGVESHWGIMFANKTLKVNLATIQNPTC